MEIVTDDRHGSAPNLDVLAFELAPFDLVHVVEEVRSELGDRARDRGAGLTARYAIDVPRSLVGDAERLRQILRVLLGGALEHAEAETPVTLAIQGEKVRESTAALRFRIELAGSLADEWSRSPELAAPAPAGDERGRRDFALCQRIIEHMGGRFGTLRVPGRGTYFWFNLVLPLDTSKKTGAFRT